jgi:hypothetical protein
MVTCKFKIPGEPNDVKMSPRFPHKEYHFLGSLPDGKCGIKIDRVKAENLNPRVPILIP